MRFFIMTVIAGCLLCGCVRRNRGNFVQVWKNNVYAKGAVNNRSSEQLGWLELDLRVSDRGAISNVFLELKGHQSWPSFQ